MPRALDLTRQKFGRLTVLELHHRTNKDSFWVCKCNCGKNKIMRKRHLTQPGRRSCGCWATEYRKDRNSNSSKALVKCKEKTHPEGTNLNILKTDVPNSANTKGVKGVSYDRVTKKFTAWLRLRGKCHWLGRHCNLADAAKARKEAEEKYFKPILEKYGVVK